MKTVLCTCVVIPIELHPSDVKASAEPDFGGVTARENLVKLLFTHFFLNVTLPKFSKIFMRLFKSFILCKNSCNYFS